MSTDLGECQLVNLGIQESVQITGLYFYSLHNMLLFMKQKLIKFLKLFS